jgi:hypothetical protein
MTPLHWAATGGAVPCVSWLLSSGGSTASTAAHDGAMPRDKRGRTPLHAAAACGQAAVVHWLTAAPSSAQAVTSSLVTSSSTTSSAPPQGPAASVHDVDVDGRTALHCAVVGGGDDVIATVTALLAAGARADTADGNGDTAVQLARRAGNDDVITAVCASVTPPAAPVIRGLQWHRSDDAARPWCVRLQWDVAPHPCPAVHLLGFQVHVTTHVPGSPLPTGPFNASDSVVPVDAAGEDLLARASSLQAVLAVSAACFLTAASVIPTTCSRRRVR